MDGMVKWVGGPGLAKTTGKFGIGVWTNQTRNKLSAVELKSQD
jgi:hypothetical protein